MKREVNNMTNTLKKEIEEIIKTYELLIKDTDEKIDELKDEMKSCKYDFQVKQYLDMIEEEEIEKKYYLSKIEHLRTL